MTGVDIERVAGVIRCAGGSGAQSISATLCFYTVQGIMIQALTITGSEQGMARLAAEAV